MKFLLWEIYKEQRWFLRSWGKDQDLTQTFQIKSNQINLYLYGTFHTEKYRKVPYRDVQTAEKEKHQIKSGEES